LARLAIIRKEREDAARKKEEEKKGISSRAVLCFVAFFDLQCCGFTN
jgi:hypothetical protein